MRWSVLPVTAVLAVLVVAAAAGPSAAAPGNGGISGVVRNATTTQVMANQAVSLVFVGTQGPEQVAEGRTDAKGRVAFRGLSDGRYLVQTTHQAVSYAAHAVVSGGATVELVVQVYNVSAGVALRVALLGMAIDVQPGYVRISEVVHLQNGTSQTFLGNIAFPLPRGARFITFHEGLHRPAVQGDRITDRLIVRPGSHQAAYAYTLAGEGEIVLDRQIPLPVERLELFATAPAEVRSPRLEPAPTVTEEGRTYTRASGRSVPAGLLPMTIAGVPAVRLWPAPAAAGTLAALLVVGLGWAVLASGREEATRRGG